MRDAGANTVLLQVEDGTGETDVQEFVIDVELSVGPEQRYYTFLPLVTVPQGWGLNAPDLVVERIIATPDNIQVTIKNQGTASAINPFWVQVYIDPDPAPAAVNDLWFEFASEGLVWGVVHPALPIVPGEVITLTYGDAYYSSQHSKFSGSLALGTRIYAQVDAYNEGTDDGAVLETHEIAGGAYNNITGPVFVSDSTGLNAKVPDVVLSPVNVERLDPSVYALPVFPRW
jgi:hypothetical protein